MAPISPPESDIIYNRVNVTVAQKIRSIASWNPPRAANGSVNTTNPGEETKSDELESGTALPELTGFGATMREDGVVERGGMSGNDRLRKQLLGKDHIKKLARGKRAHGAGAVGMANQPRPAAPARREEHDWDSGDEGGRSSLGKSKLGARKHRLKEEEEEEEEQGSGRVDDETEELAAHGSKVRAKQVPKRASNYLDEVLADRSLRRRKKSRKKDRAMEN